MSGDSAYSYDISRLRSAGRDCLRIKGVRRVAGYDAQEFSYVLAADTYAPMEMELENNPGRWESRRLQSGSQCRIRPPTAISPSRH